MSEQLSYFKQYARAGAWALFILFACGASPGTLKDLQLSDLFGYDKPIHAFLFGMQSWLLIRARIKSPYHSYKKIVWVCCIAGALFGALVELMQKWVFTGRSYDYYDMIANTFGCVVVLIVMLRVRVIPITIGSER